MFLDINKIGAKGTTFDRAVRLSGLEGPSHERLEPIEAVLRGEARRGSRGVHLRGRLETVVTLRCSRCAEPFQREISGEFFLILVPDAVEAGADSREGEVDRDDTALYHAADGKASFAEIATEQIYLNLPIKPICRRDCRGLCPECGEDRNRGACACRERTVDPRLAPLLQFKRPNHGS